MSFSKQEPWSELLFPSPGDLPNSGIEPVSPALAGGFFTTEPPGKPILYIVVYIYQSKSPNSSHVHVPLSEHIKFIIALITLEDKFWNHEVKVQI